MSKSKHQCRINFPNNNVMKICFWLGSHFDEWISGCHRQKPREMTLVWKDPGCVLDNLIQTPNADLSGAGISFI